MDKVILTAVGVGDKSFDVDHAQRILDLKANPKVWKLNDPDYLLVEGKITPKSKKEVK